MNVFKRELKQLRKLEKAILKYRSLSRPDGGDILKLWSQFKSLDEIGMDKNQDFSDSCYHKLFKKYGNPDLSVYEDRLRMYTYYSDKVPLLLRQELTVTEYNYLIDLYKELCIQIHEVFK